MAYIGNSPFVSGNFSSSVHNGTGSELTFAMGQSPGTKNAVLVFIDGVRQVPTIYNVSGSDVVFTAGNAPPLGVGNVQILVSGEELGVNVPADDSIAVAALDTTSAGTTGQFLKKSGASTIDWATVSAGSITTEGDYFYNYNTISSDITTTVETSKAAFVAGPITIADTYTWTISGELTMI
jgi:hypothetical protein